MVRIAPDLLKAGMKLAKPVYSITGNFLVPENIILTDRIILKLRRFRLEAVYIDLCL